MKKYNKPEIVTLALDAVDVIETSAVEVNSMLDAKGYGAAEVKYTATITENVSQMNDNWNW